MNPILILKKYKEYRKKMQNESSNEKDTASYNFAVFLDLRLKRPSFIHSFFIKKSIHFYKNAVDITPQNPIFNYYLGFAFYRAGEKKGAEEYYTAAWELQSAYLLHALSHKESDMEFSNAFAYLNNFIACTYQLTVLQLENGELKDNGFYCYFVLSHLSNPVLFNSFMPIETELLPTLVLLYFTNFIQNSLYDNLFDFLSSRTYIFYSNQFKDTEQIKIIEKQKIILEKIKDLLVDYKTFNPVKKWKNDFYRTIQNISSIEKAIEIWNGLNTVIVTKEIRDEFQQSQSNIILDLKDQISKTRDDHKNLIVDVSKYKNIFDDIQVDPKVKILLDRQLSLMELSNSFLTSLNELCIKVLENNLDIIVNQFKSIDRIPFRWRFKWFLLNIQRNLLDIIISLVILGNVIPMVVENEISSARITSFILSVVIFVLTKLFIDPKIKQKYINIYKRFLTENILNIYTNLNTLYMEYITIRNITLSKLKANENDEI